MSNDSMILIKVQYFNFSEKNMFFFKLSIFYCLETERPYDFVRVERAHEPGEASALVRRRFPPPQLAAELSLHWSWFLCKFNKSGWNGYQRGGILISLLETEANS